MCLLSFLLIQVLVSIVSVLKLRRSMALDGTVPQMSRSPCQVVNAVLCLANLKRVWLQACQCLTAFHGMHLTDYFDTILREPWLIQHSAYLDYDMRCPASMTCLISCMLPRRFHHWTCRMIIIRSGSRMCLKLHSGLLLVGISSGC